MMGLLKSQLLARKANQSQQTTQTPHTSLHAHLLAAAVTTNAVQKRLEQISQLQRAESGDNSLSNFYDMVQDDSDNDDSDNDDSDNNNNNNNGSNDNSSDSDDNSLLDLDFSNRSFQLSPIALQQTPTHTNSSPTPEERAASGVPITRNARYYVRRTNSHGSSDSDSDSDSSNSLHDYDFGNNSIGNRNNNSHHALSLSLSLSPTTLPVPVPSVLPIRTTRADLLELSLISSAHTRSPSPDDCYDSSHSSHSTASSSDGSGRDGYTKSQQRQRLLPESIRNVNRSMDTTGSTGTSTSTSMVSGTYSNRNHKININMPLFLSPTAPSLLPSMHTPPHHEDGNGEKNRAISTPPTNYYTARTRRTRTNDKNDDKNDDLSYDKASLSSARRRLLFAPLHQIELDGNGDNVDDFHGEPSLSEDLHGEPSLFSGEPSMSDKLDYQNVLDRALLPDHAATAISVTRTRTKTKTTVPAAASTTPTGTSVPWTWYLARTSSTSTPTAAAAAATFLDKQYSVDTMMKHVAYVGLASSLAVAAWVVVAATPTTTTYGMTLWTTLATAVWSIYILYVDHVSATRLSPLQSQQVALQQTLSHWKRINSHARSKHMAAQAAIQRWNLLAGVPAGDYYVEQPTNANVNGTTTTTKDLSLTTTMPSPSKSPMSVNTNTASIQRRHSTTMSSSSSSKSPSQSPSPMNMSTASLQRRHSTTMSSPSKAAQSSSESMIMSTASIQRRHMVATELLAAKRKIRYHQRSQISKAVVEVLVNKKNAQGQAGEQQGWAWNKRSIQMLELRLLKIKGVRLDKEHLMTWWESQRQQECSPTDIIKDLFRNALFEENNSFFVFEAIVPRKQSPMKPKPKPNASSRSISNSPTKKKPRDIYII